MKSFRQFLYENVTSDLQDLAMNAQGSVADIASTHGKGLIGSLGKQIGVLGKLTDLNTATIGGVVETGLQKLAGAVRTTKVFSSRLLESFLCAVEDKAIKDRD